MFRGSFIHIICSAFDIVAHSEIYVVRLHEVNSSRSELELSHDLCLFTRSKPNCFVLRFLN